MSRAIELRADYTRGELRRLMTYKIFAQLSRAGGPESG